jgi:hypothetical protein
MSGKEGNRDESSLKILKILLSSSHLSSGSQLSLSSLRVVMSSANSLHSMSITLGSKFSKLGRIKIMHCCEYLSWFSIIPFFRVRSVEYEAREQILIYQALSGSTWLRFWKWHHNHDFLEYVTCHLHLVFIHKGLFLPLAYPE